MMGMDKGSTKRGGFFHLFDWNKKSRKKLFSSGSVSPESPKQEKKSKESFSRTRRRLDDDDEIFGVTSGRRSCDYSCASSMTDEDGMTHRAPGVIARLMGLESMPTPIFSESSSTPFFDTRSLPDKQRDKRNSEFYINDQFSDKVHKIMETKSQRMPSSPIERFQTEPIPPRSARSVPITHHKLLSPIKNSGYISNKNASYIMEAAAKILDHRDQPSVKHNVSAFGSASATLKVSSNSKNNTIIPQSHRRTRVVEPSSTSFESAEFRNQNTIKSSNGADATTGQGKTVSLAIQAKVNVQKRVGLLSSRSSLSQKQENNESVSNPLFNNQPNNYKNRQQHKSYANNTSSLLKQNSQKQNFVSKKANLNSKQSISKQLNTNASSVKKNPNRISGSYRFSLVDKEASLSSSSSCLSNNRRKRLTERSYIQSNVVIDEHGYSKRHEDYRSNSSDVVSFTFTSPLNKHGTENRISEDVVEGMCTFNNHSQHNNEYANNEHISSPGMNVITGDALSLLLDQKLRELTHVPEPESSSCVSEERVSGFDSIDTASVEHELLILHNDKAGSNFGYGAASVNGQEVEECSSYSDARKDLETSYSSESSNFSERSDMTDGSGRTCSSSIQAQNNFSSSINKSQSTETDSELSDSACSTITDNSYVSDQFNSNSAKSSNYELDFLEEILHSAQSSIILGDKINPHLFEKLEENKTKKDKSEKLRRKILFDCANECMEIKCNRYFSTGYQAWLKGMAVTGDRTLGREIYDEISKWKSMEEWMIDEVVDQDMSSYFGKWLNYETEASAIALQIEKEITCCLIDEVIVDYSIKPTCR